MPAEEVSTALTAIAMQHSPCRTVTGLDLFAEASCFYHISPVLLSMHHRYFHFQLLCDILQSS